MAGRRKKPLRNVDIILVAFKYVSKFSQAGDKHSGRRRKRGERREGIYLNGGRKIPTNL